MCRESIFLYLIIIFIKWFSAPQPPCSTNFQEFQHQGSLNQSQQQFSYLGSLLDDLVTDFRHQTEVKDKSESEFSKELDKRRDALISHPLMFELQTVLTEIKKERVLPRLNAMVTDQNNDNHESKIQNLNLLLITEGVIDPPPSSPRPVR